MPNENVSPKVTTKSPTNLGSVSGPSKWRSICGSCCQYFSAGVNRKTMNARNVTTSANANATVAPKAAMTSAMIAGPIVKLSSIMIESTENAMRRFTSSVNRCRHKVRVSTAMGGANAPAKTAAVMIAAFDIRSVTTANSSPRKTLFNTPVMRRGQSGPVRSIMRPHTGANTAIETK